MFVRLSVRGEKRHETRHLIISSSLPSSCSLPLPPPTTRPPLRLARLARPPRPPPIPPAAGVKLLSTELIDYANSIQIELLISPPPAVRSSLWRDLDIFFSLPPYRPVSFDASLWLSKWLDSSRILHPSFHLLLPLPPPSSPFLPLPPPPPPSRVGCI